MSTAPQPSALSPTPLSGVPALAEVLAAYRQGGRVPRSDGRFGFPGKGGF